MNSYQEISVVEGTFLSLNDTRFSHHTKNSGEREYKELAAMINKMVRDDKENMSILSSSKLVDNSYSIISNDEIWKGDRSSEDSKNFIENFRKIDEKKCIKINNESNSLKNYKDDVFFKDLTASAIINRKEEDYNDEVEESVEFSKYENLTRLKINETKNNNLNEMYQNPIKFYTSPNDISDYRSSYPYSNFSFTPQSELNINKMMNPNLICSPKNYAFPRIPESYLINEDSNRLSKQINLSDTKENKKINNQSNPYFIKYYTPTHPNSSHLTNKNDLATVQKELNFYDLSQDNSKVQINNNQQPIIQFKAKNNPNMINNIKFNNPQPYNYQTFSSLNSTPQLDNRTKTTASNFSNKNYVAISMNDTKSYKFERNSEEYFDLKINLENIIMGKDKRTILMIRNVPNKYSLSNVVDEINTNFMGKYDYLNLPTDPERKLNLGYSFINFVDPLHIVLFYEIYFNKKWNRYRSDKVNQTNNYNNFRKLN